MAYRLARVTALVQIPAHDYEDTAADILSEVESALQRAGVTYTTPELVSAGTDDG